MEVKALTVGGNDIMRKIELIPTHALLLEVAQYLIENGDIPAEAMFTYYALDVRPSSVHKSKQAHYEAITILANSIEWWTEQTRSPSPENWPQSD